MAAKNEVQRRAGASVSICAIHWHMSAPCSPSGLHEPQSKFTARCEWPLKGEDLERSSGGSWPCLAPSHPLLPSFNRPPIVASQLLAVLLRVVLKSLLEERQICLQPITPALEMINGEYRPCMSHRRDSPPGRQQRVANARRCLISLNEWNDDLANDRRRFVRRQGNPSLTVNQPGTFNSMRPIVAARTQID